MIAVRVLRTDRRPRAVLCNRWRQNKRRFRNVMRACRAERTMRRQSPHARPLIYAECITVRFSRCALAQRARRASLSLQTLADTTGIGSRCGEARCRYNAYQVRSEATRKVKKQSLGVAERQARVKHQALSFLTS